MLYLTFETSDEIFNPRIIKKELYQIIHNHSKTNGLDTGRSQTHLSLMVNVVEVFPGLGGGRLTLDVADAPNTYTAPH